MTPLAHLSSSFLVYKAAISYYHSLQAGLILGLALAGSFAPDIDGLFGRKLNIHRYTAFHAPLFWLTIFIGASILNRIFGSTAIQEGTLVFTIGVFFHLLLDWMSARTCGVMILHPFSKKPYSLFNLKSEMGNIPTFPNKSHLGFWKFYLSNRFLVGIEVALILAGIVAIIIPL